MPPRLSIILVTYNSARVLPSALESIPAAADSIPFEVIIIDNNSRDSSADTAVRQMPDAVIIRNTNNIGFAAACNQGAAIAKGEWLFFANPDLAMDAGSLTTLLAEGERSAKAGLIVPRLRLPDGQFHPTCRRLPSPYSILFSRGSALNWLYEKTSGQKTTSYTLPDYPATTSVPAVAATAALIRADLFQTVGGFDTRFFLYMEDTDLSFRLTQSGYQNLFVPSSGGVHLWKKGSDVWPMVRLSRQHFSVWQYFLKHVPNGYSLIVLPILLALNLILSIFGSVRGR